MTALNTFGASLAPGQFAEFACPSVAALYDSVARVFEPSAAARADAQANGWTAAHMADWWSHLAWDRAADTYWVAGGRDRQKALPQNLVSYSAGTNTWTHRPNWSGAAGGHCYQGTAVGGGKAYYLGGGGVQVWDMATDNFGGALPAPPNNVCPPFTSSLAAGAALAYVPWMGAQGSLLMVNTNSHATDPTRRVTRIARLDLATVAWLPVFAQRNVWNNQHTLALVSRHQQTVLVGASTAAAQLPLGMLDANGNMTFLPVGPMNATTAGGTTSRALLIEHPQRAEPIFFCLGTARIWSLPPGSSAWIDRGAVPSALLNANSVALPTEFGAAFVRYASAGNSKMYAWKPDF